MIASAATKFFRCCRVEMLVRKMKAISGPCIGEEKPRFGRVRLDLLAQPIDKHAKIF